MAQWLAQGTHNSLVAGSNPAGPIKIGKIGLSRRLGLKKPERLDFKITLTFLLVHREYILRRKAWHRRYATTAVWKKTRKNLTCDISP